MRENDDRSRTFPDQRIYTDFGDRLDPGRLHFRKARSRVMVCKNNAMHGLCQSRFLAGDEVDIHCSFLVHGEFRADHLRRTVKFHHSMPGIANESPISARIEHLLGLALR
jgi:hypothetical protein